MTLRAKRKVKILAVEMETVDAYKLRTSRIGIVGLLDPNNKEWFSNCFVRVLGPKNLGKKKRQ